MKFTPGKPAFPSLIPEPAGFTPTGIAPVDTYGLIEHGPVMRFHRSPCSLFAVLLHRDYEFRFFRDRPAVFGSSGRQVVYRILDLDQTRSQDVRPETGDLIGKPWNAQEITREGIASGR